MSMEHLQQKGGTCVEADYKRLPHDFVVYTAVLEYRTLDTCTAQKM